MPRSKIIANSAPRHRHSTLQECRREAEQVIQHMRAKLEADPGSTSRQQAAARQRAAETREQRVRAALDVTAELHAQAQEQARRDAERAAKQAQPDETTSAKGKATTAETKSQRKPREPRASTTDAEARIMKMADGGFRPAFNVQFAADTESTAIAAVSEPVAQSAWERRVDVFWCSSVLTALAKHDSIIALPRHGSSDGAPFSHTGTTSGLPASG